MKRAIPVAAVAAVLFVVNIAGRYLSPTGNDATTYNMQTMVGVVAATVMGLFALGVGLYWSMRVPLQRVVSELGLGLLIGAALAVFVAPLTLAMNPFSADFGLLLAELIIFFGIEVLGAFVGFMIAATFGIDYRSKNLKRVERYYGRKSH
ncbi:MAG TPA: hypothetical protein VE172_19505 [Stackebrandtia sp.]|jgi:hypothetical protein|uniref:hypothetical protein n=1 Tax=Stackebrandtia sp. TaxID=2023065 RepID=UPI002D2DD31C|nr:hypothetical protein [Stackebrandtia sp.]HZE40991.1 hypothetical protein [Stackebrandtia sp.]